VSEFLCILLSCIGFLLRDALQRATSTVAEGVSCLLFFLAFYMADAQLFKTLLDAKVNQISQTNNFFYKKVVFFIYYCYFCNI